MSEGKTLIAALIAAQARAEGVDKAARNDFHGYAYASAEAIIAEARAALSAEGLAMFPVSVDRDPEAKDHTWTGEGDDAWISQPRRIKSIYRLVHVSGESLEFTSTTPVIPEKGRPEDKAEFGARTENLGYALRDLLLLPRVNVETPSGRDDRDKPAPRPPSKAISGERPKLGDEYMIPSEVAKVREALDKVLPLPVPGKPRDPANASRVKERIGYVTWAAGVGVDEKKGLDGLTKFQGSMVILKANSGEMPPAPENAA